MKSIDINCDMGEVPEAIADGTQEALMPFLTSVNIACGGHAGDERTMAATIAQAIRWKLAIGAHPGYPDRANFGRNERELPLDVVSHLVFHQVQCLAGIAADHGIPLAHVKAHGALYNQAVNNRELAAAIAAGVSHYSRDLVLVGMAGSPMLEVFREAGFATAAEAFVDRRYEPDGTLRSRKFNDALLADPAAAVQQALRIANRAGVIASDGSDLGVNAQTLCIHSDTPGAPHIAAAVAQALRNEGFTLRSRHSISRGSTIAGTLSR